MLGMVYGDKKQTSLFVMDSLENTVQFEHNRRNINLIHMH